MTSSKRNIIVFFSFMIVFVIAQFFFGAECSDGFASQSIGSKGACSHHGGVSHIGGIFSLIISFFISFILFKSLKVTISAEEVKRNREEFKNLHYNLKDKYCYRCKGKVISMRYKGDKFPYWACENIAKNKCDTKPIKKFL